MNFQDALGLTKPPVAVGLFDAVPSGLEKWQGGPVPAGCSFWREAMKGRAFYTAAGDHYNCAVGSYTHSIALPPERAAELQGTIGFMVGNRYIEMAEVPGIPTLARTPAFVAYAPVMDAPFSPQFVLLAARPGSAMLIYEAALRAGAGNLLTTTLGRPGCAVIPLVEKTGTAALSFGCKGNRTFTGLPDDELYICIPGAKWEALLGAVDAIREANAAMSEYYLGRAQAFPILG